MIKKFFLFKESTNINNPTIQKLVDKLKKLLDNLHTKYGKGKDAFILEDDMRFFYLYSIVYIKGLLTVKSSSYYNKDIYTHIFDDHSDEDSDERIISILKGWISCLNKNEKNRIKYNIFSLKDRLNFKNTVIKKLVDELNDLLKKHIAIYGKNENSFLVYFFSKKDSYTKKNYNIYYLYSVVYKNAEVIIKSSEDDYNKNIKIDNLKDNDYAYIDSVINRLNTWIGLLKENQTSRLRYDNLLNYYNRYQKFFIEEIEELNDEINILLNCLYDKNGKQIWVFNKSSFENDDTIDSVDRHYTNYHKKEDFKRRINKLKGRISLYRRAIQKKGIHPLTPYEYDKLSKFMTELTNLSNTTNYINLEATNNDHYTYFVEDNLDEDLKKYNTIPGVYMEQSGNFIKIHITLTKVFFLIHEQYISKIYKIYQSVKN
jgi:hypothetical protein